MIRMIGLDLDGTLLTGEKKLTPGNKQALGRAAELGISIVPVTGRPLSGIPREVLDLQFVHYVITSNGALIYDRSAGQPVRTRYMPTETAGEVLEAAADPYNAENTANTVREFFAGGFGYDDGNSWKLLMHKFAGTPLVSYLRASRIVVEDLFDSLREKGRENGGIENISIMFRSFEEREAARSRIEQIRGVRIIRPNRTDLEIPSSEADKGTALLDLAGRLGVRQEEIMAMGDGNNDLNLLQSAGTAVAMENAADDVRKAADFVTLDNEHDGVAAAIRKFVPESCS